MGEVEDDQCGSTIRRRHRSSVVGASPKWDLYKFPQGRVPCVHAVVALQPRYVHAKHDTYTIGMQLCAPKRERFGAAAKVAAAHIRRRAELSRGHARAVEEVSSLAYGPGK